MSWSWRERRMERKIKEWIAELEEQMEWAPSGTYAHIQNPKLIKKLKDIIGER